MSAEKRSVILAFILVSLGGAALHFVYSFAPSVVTALVAPVAESVWEHVKLIYFPGLIAALVLGKRYGGWGSRLLALLLGCTLVLALGYLYNILWGGAAHWVNIAIYLLAVLLVFWLPKPLELRLRGRFSELFVLLVIALGGAILLFTFLPPDARLYADLSVVNTWSVIPF